MQEVDYIIVGQGLAGSAVAVQLLKRKKKIVVIDQPENNISSRIAAGLFNPITGKKMVKTWLADTLFPYLFSFYREVEEKTGARFFFPTPLYRPFLSIAEQNEWMARSAEPAYSTYIESVCTRSSFSNTNDIFGGLLLKQCGYLNTVHYLGAVKEWIEQEGVLLTETFNEHKISSSPNGIQYGNFNASKIIFCQGVHANEIFRELPIRALKGETIKIKSDFKNTVIINRGVYLVPGDEPGEWRIGATYDFNSSAPGTTMQAKETLEQKMKELVNFPFEFVSQDWGLRPTTPDRRPILGEHPNLPGMIIFNGLGTKGVSLSPYFSEVLIRWIENKIPLNKEVDMERYKSVY